MKNPTPAYRTGSIVLPAKPQSIATFEALYDRYAPALFGVIHFIIPDDQIATEVLQISFVQIWEKIGDYNADKMQLFTWLYHITKKVACDYKRSLPDQPDTNADLNVIQKAAAFSEFAKKYGRL